MQTKKCEVCNNDFEGRENQKYCSDACKQQAYKKRKTGEKETPQEQTKILGHFKMSEFKNSNLSDFLTFCFFRKNYKIEFDAEKFNAYVNGFSESETFVKLADKNTIEGIEFEKFKKQFYQGFYEVIE